MEGVFNLDIDDKIKEGFREQKFAGRLISLIMDVERGSQIDSLIEIIEYKKSLL